LAQSQALSFGLLKAPEIFDFMNLWERIVVGVKRRWSRDGRYYAIVSELLGICPRNIELYKLALLHRSASVELADGTHLNNERLEFLGDAVLGAVVSDYLFVEFPHLEEGGLTRLRSKIVSRQTLNVLAHSIGLDKHIIRHTSGAFAQKHIDGDALEAMIGAVYLDRGYERANKLLINNIFRNHLDLGELISSETDHKSRLIEWCQKNHQSIHFETSPDANYTTQRPVFRSVVMIEGIEVGHGRGETKKQAEQHAAEAVSEVMSDQIGDYILETIDNISNGAN
jgi:ribonuclease-3